MQETIYSAFKEQHWLLRSSSSILLCSWPDGNSHHCLSQAFSPEGGSVSFLFPGVMATGWLWLTSSVLVKRYLGWAFIGAKEKLELYSCSLLNADLILERKNKKRTCTVTVVLKIATIYLGGNAFVTWLLYISPGLPGSGFLFHRHIQ